MGQTRICPARLFIWTVILPGYAGPMKKDFWFRVIVFSGSGLSIAVLVLAFFVV
jgi:hypothetical protein